MKPDIIFNGVRLTTTCPDCKGTGYAENPAWSQYRPGMNLDAFANEHGDQESSCVECEGRCWVMTQDGLILAEFIRTVTS
mgnify:FL=1